MPNKTAVNVVLYYLNNLLTRPLFGEMQEQVCGWFENNARELIGSEVDEAWESRSHTRWRGQMNDEEPRLPRVAKTITRFLNGKTGKLTIVPGVQAIIDAFNLSPECHEVLAMRYYCESIPLLEKLVNSHHGFSSQEMQSGMLKMAKRQYEKFYAGSGELVSKGLFGPSVGHHQSRGRHWAFDPTDTLSEIMLADCRTVAAVRQAILGKPLRATLQPEHFEHIGKDYQDICKILVSAIAKKGRGVNVLIYGSPGTGKTEIAKTICKEIGSPLYAISGDTDNERSSNGRRSDLAAALSLLQDDSECTLLMDEAEDVFGASGSRGRFFDGDAKPDSGSKLFFNRLLETNAVPVIWISNQVYGVDPAHLRRFAFALKMETPDETVQARIWSQSARKNKVSLPKAKITQLASTYDIAPAIIDTSLRTAALTGDQATIETTIDSLQSVMGRTNHKRGSNTDNLVEFSTDLLNCDIDLGQLVEQVSALDTPQFSLCLHGVPGSGKSAYARYLAGHLKMKVLYKRASDLIDMYVGSTERNIADAFAHARKNNMLLIFDEADSFLRDRRSAHRSWETTQVNEMLAQMESHPLPFVCTTNLMDDLDQASLRRFTFKVKYDYLKPEQVALAFKHFFGEPSTVSFNGLDRISPGDFAVVAKQAKIRKLRDHSELVKRLHQEQEIKEGEKPSQFGFAR